MSTKKQKILFWALTGPIIAAMLASGLALVTKQRPNLELMAHLGYPIYFVVFLGVAKLLGSCALLYRKSTLLTEWAYAGFTFDFLGASWSHFGSNDGALKALIPLVFLGLLWGSYSLWKKPIIVTSGE